MTCRDTAFPTAVLTSQGMKRHTSSLLSATLSQEKEVSMCCACYEPLLSSLSLSHTHQTWQAYLSATVRACVRACAFVPEWSKKEGWQEWRFLPFLSAFCSSADRKKGPCMYVCMYVHLSRMNGKSIDNRKSMSMSTDGRASFNPFRHYWALVTLVSVSRSGFIHSLFLFIDRISQEITYAIGCLQSGSTACLFV